MQASYSVPRTPTTIFAVLATLLVALVAGGTGGYLLRGPADSSAVTARPASVGTSAIPSTGRQYLYEQGGRPTVVYDDASRLSSR
jgi:hypothetical protein